MTRGQESLVIETVEVNTAVGDDTQVDLSGFELPVLSADDAELAGHEAVLADLDKASGGKTVWRSLVQ
jgi:DNA polymerase-3 subunit epsilon